MKSFRIQANAILLVAGLAVSNHAYSACTGPEAAHVPRYTPTVTKETLVALNQRVKAYQAAASEYVKCLEREISANRSVETVASAEGPTGVRVATLRGSRERVLTIFHHATVTEMEAIAMTFNTLLRDYRKANP
jgi:hypothetical protein